jgi:flagellar protein FlgJ
MNFAVSAVDSTPLAGAASPPTVQHRKLVEAAQQFEGMLLQEMLKPMKEHGFAQEEADDGSGDKDGGGFGETLSSYGTETLATAIAKGGGIGIAKRVVAQVEGEKASRLEISGERNPAKPG